MRGRDKKQRKQSDRQQPRQPQKDAGVTEKLAALVAALVRPGEKNERK